MVINISGQEVNGSGGFSYSYPIEIPPGTNGLQPKISLNYNSQGRNGLAGMGWTLSGFPTIERDASYPVNYNYSDHYKYKGQKLIPIPGTSQFKTEKDNFLRIEADSKYAPNYWTVHHKNGTKYIYGKYENTYDDDYDGFIKIDGSNAARRWYLCMVRDLYGNYYTIKYNKENGLLYPTKITYTQGNDLSKFRTVDLSYESRDDSDIAYQRGEIKKDKRLKSIIVSIDNFKIREYDFQYSYSPVTKNSLLKSIHKFGLNKIPEETGVISFEYGDSVEINKTNLEHNNIMYVDLRRGERLYTLDINGDGKKDILKKSIIKTRNTIWLNNNNSFDLSYVVHEDLQIGESELVLGDFTGDGTTDALRLGDVLRSTNEYPKGDPTANNFYIGSGSILTKPKHTLQYENFIGSSIDVHVADFNGDGIDDLLRAANDNTLNAAFFGLGDGTFAKLPLSRFTLRSPSSMKLLLNDFNNDGKTDIFVSKINSRNNEIYYANSSRGFNSSYSFISKIPLGAEDVKTVLSDFNGDGNTDILVLQKDGSNEIYYLDEGVSQRPRSYQIILPDEHLFSDSNEIQVGDFNGDKRMDLLVLSANWQENRIFEYQPGGFIQKPFLNTNSLMANTILFNKVFVTDFNGDGKSNIFSLFAELPEHVKVNDVTNTDDEMHSFSNIESDKIISIITEKGGKIEVDYNSLTALDDINDTKDFDPIITKHNTYSSKARTAPCIVTTKIKFIPIVGATAENYERRFEYHNYREKNGSSTEKEDLGFEKIKRVNPDGSYNITYFSQAVDNHGVIQKKQKYGNDNKLYTETEYIYGEPIAKIAPTSTYKGSYFHPLNQEISRDYNGETTVQTETRKEYLQYDEWGNAAQIMNHGVIAVKGDETKEIYTYNAYSDSNFYRVGLTEKKILGYSLDETEYNDFNDDNASAIEHTYYVYYLDRNNTEWPSLGEFGLGKVCAISKDSGQTENQSDYPTIDRNYGYDKLGNLEWEEENTWGWMKFYEYDDKFHTLLSKTIDYKRQAEETIYNDIMKPAMTIDKNGLISRIEYDSLGRVLNKKSPYDLITEPSFSNKYIKHDLSLINVFIPSGKKVRSKVGNGKYLESYTYFDGFGRILQTKEEHYNEDGLLCWKTIDLYYNQAGKNFFTSVPYLSTSSSYTERVGYNSQIGKQIQYDSIGRPIQLTNTDQTVKRTYYKKNAVINVDENNHVTSVQKLGNISYQMNFEGKFNESLFPQYIDHTLNGYYSCVQTKTAANGTWIRTEDENKKYFYFKTYVDSLGRTMHTEDLSLGNWKYTYDDPGRLKSMTDGRGIKTNIISDEIGRVTGKTYPDGTSVEYFYDGEDENRKRDTARFGEKTIGKLNLVIFPGGSESYKYDDLGRVETLTKTINGKSRSIKFTYDAIGKVLTEEYPDGEIITYAYNHKGMLESVENDSSLKYIYALNYELNNKINSFAYGNGMRTTYDYYDESNGRDTYSNLSNSYLLQRILFSHNVKNEFQEIYFNYDKCRNVKFKGIEIDYDRYTDDTYDYDEFHRLVRAIGGSQDTINYYIEKKYIYDNLNNLLQKGEMGYGFDHENRMDFILNEDTGIAYEFGYDLNGNIDYKEIDQKEIEIFSYDNANRLKSILNDRGASIYSYDHSERRIMKSEMESTTIVINAKGSGTLVNPPIMELWIDGHKKKKWIVNNGNYQDFTCEVGWDGKSTIDIVFPNDNHDGEDKVDTNLYISFITVNGSKFNPFDSTIYDTGWPPKTCFDGENIKDFPGNMCWSGALRFTATSAAPASKDTYYFFPNYEEEYLDDVLQSTTKYYFANGQRIAQSVKKQNEDAKILYYHSDHLGSSVMMTDESGNRVMSSLYSPYGELLYSSGDESTKYQFTGQEKDEVTGYNYYGARYYDPEIGRFLQADTVLDGINRYAYCQNNPVKYVDPTGHEAESTETEELTAEIIYFEDENEDFITVTDSEGETVNVVDNPEKDTEVSYGAKIDENSVINVPEGSTVEIQFSNEQTITIEGGNGPIKTSDLYLSIRKASGVYKQTIALQGTHEVTDNERAFGKGVDTFVKGIVQAFVASKTKKKKTAIVAGSVYAGAAEKIKNDTGESPGTWLAWGVNETIRRYDNYVYNNFKEIYSYPTVNNRNPFGFSPVW